MTMNLQTVRESFFRQGEPFRVLFSQLSEHMAVHAYLITGEKGTGKHTLARMMGAALFCSSESGKPCGRCRNCLLAEKNEHSDMIVIEKGNPIAAGIRKDRNTIPVEDIREMIRLCSIRSTDGSMHVVVISEADRMTLQAQNCLLKTLEEPPPETCIILISDHTEGLLSTVISRCRTIRLKAWDDEYILSVLEGKGIPPERAAEASKASGGSIGKAIELAEDDNYWELRREVRHIFFETTSRSKVLEISNQWKDRKQDAEKILEILESYVKILTESRFGEAETDLSVFPVQWKHFSENAPKSSFVMLIQAVEDVRRQLQFSTNFQAVLEKLIFVFIGEGNKWLQL